MSQAAPPAPKRALGIIFLIVFMDLLGFGVIIPQLPFYARQYQATALQVTILFSIYSMCQFGAAPILGSISDRIGRRPILIISQFGSALGYAMLGAVTHHQWANPLTGLMLIYVSRAIDGISGGNISTAQAYISDVTTHENRAKGMGILGAAFGVGFAAGPALGAFAGPSGYEFVPAYIAAGLSGIAAILTFLLLPESHHAIRARDIALTKTTLEEDIATPVNPPALTEPEVSGAATMSGASPVSGEAPPRDLLERLGIRAATRSPILLQLLLLSFCSMAAFVMMESTVAIFLADTFNWGSRNVGYFFACIGVIIVVVQGGLIGRLTKALGEWPLAIAGPLFVAIGMACFARVGVVPWVALLMLGAATNATGRSLQQPTVSSLISKFSDPREQGVIFGLYHGLSSVARVIGPIIAGLAYERHHTGPFIVAGTIALVIFVWTAWLRQRATHAASPAVVT